MNEKQLDPYNTFCVCKVNGKEVGRILASDPNAENYMTDFVRHYGSLEVEYVEDATAAMIARLLK